jgi:hypothetical protein
MIVAMVARRQINAEEKRGKKLKWSFLDRLIRKTEAKVEAKKLTDAEIDMLLGNEK